MSDSLKRDTYDDYKDRYYKKQEEAEIQEMWIELAWLDEKGLPYPKTTKMNKEKAQLALERAMLKTEFIFGEKEDDEGIPESDSTN